MKKKLKNQRPCSLQSKLKGLKKEKKEEVEIKYVPYGIGSRVGDTIYLNQELLWAPWSPDLHNAILSHELEHTSGFSKKDIKLDLFNNSLSSVRGLYYKFLLSNPSSWVEFFPIWKYEKTMVYNPLTALVWVLGLIASYLIFSLVA